VVHISHLSNSKRRPVFYGLPLFRRRVLVFLSGATREEQQAVGSKQSGHRIADQPLAPFQRFSFLFLNARHRTVPGQQLALGRA
jgi:hypothetical protein